MSISQLRTRLIIGLVVLLGLPLMSVALANDQASGASGLSGLADQPRAITPQAIGNVKLLDLDQKTRAILEAGLGHIQRPEKLARSLHVFLFGQGFYGIAYDFAVTGTAQQTFDVRVGNCLSQASLYVAAARYLGLDARFQSVDVPPQWSELDGVYMLPSHLNVMVRLGRGQDRLIVEFSNVYSAAETSLMKSRVIPDRRVVAEFYNNLAIDKLQQQALAEARAYLLKATGTYPKIDFVWSNLGVVNKKLGDFAAAEHAYKMALKINRRHMSTFNNLYALYLHQNRAREADRLARVVERYSRKNPYNLARLARIDIEQGNLPKAVALFRKAIRIKADEAQFHLQLAALYRMLGDVSRSRAQLVKARALVSDADEWARYQGELESVQQAML